MNKTLLTIFSLLLVVLALSGCSQEKTIVIKNTSKQEIVDQFESFVVMNGYSFNFANKEKGLFNILVDQTGMGVMNGSNYNNYNLVNNYSANSYGTSFGTSFNRSLNSGFSVQINQEQNDVIISSKSYGLGLRGYVFNKTGEFIKNLKAKGYEVEL